MTTRDLFYEEGGSGLSAVVLHGFPLDHTIWAPQLAGGPDARLLAPDLPGFGQSLLLPVPTPTMDDYAQAVLAWADHLGLNQFVLGGHSMGGYIAFALARLAPERVRGLVLVSTRPGADSDAARQNRETLAAAVAVQGAQATVDAMLPKLLGPGAAASPVLEQVRTLILRQERAGLIAAIRAMAARPDSTPDLDGLTMPVLILHGAADATIPPSEATAMSEAIPGSTLAVIPDAGHLPMLEQPAAVNMALRDFLNRYWP
jgi:3-oxoadipate enol-lactonase